MLLLEQRRHASRSLFVIWRSTPQIDCSLGICSKMTPMTAARPEIVYHRVSLLLVTCSQLARCKWLLTVPIALCPLVWTTAYAYGKCNQHAQAIASPPLAKRRSLRAQGT